MRPGSAWASRVAAACLAALMACWPGPAGARVLPGLETTLGGTMAISSEPDAGGWSISMSPMWPIEDRYATGVMLFADDMGADLGRLMDPNDGSDLGTTELGHTYALGAAWRLDREWGSLRTWMPYASGTWGYYHIVDDHRGRIVRRVSSTGFSLAGGVRRAVNDRHALGTSIRYHRLFNDRVGRYVGWAVDWSFR